MSASSSPSASDTSTEASSSNYKFTIKGKWSPGDPKSDAGGNPSHASFSHNPQWTFLLTQYPFTTLAINLSQYDHRWQRRQPPLKAYDTSLGYFIMRMNDMKKRLGKFHTAKVLSQAPCFSNSRSISGIVSLPPGRYAIIPCTYKACQVRKQM